MSASPTASTTDAAAEEEKEEEEEEEEEVIVVVLSITSGRPTAVQVTPGGYFLVKAPALTSRTIAS